MPNSLTSVFCGLQGRGGKEVEGGEEEVPGSNTRAGFVSTEPESELREMRE